MASLIAWHCFPWDSVHADPRARFWSSQNLKTVGLFSQIEVKCLVARAWAEGWIFKRPEPLHSGFENLAEFQCEPSFRNLLCLHWAQRDRLSCKFMPSLGGTESYWFQHVLWLDQTSSACDPLAPYLKALPWQRGQQPQWQGNGKQREVKGHRLLIDGDFPHNRKAWEVKWLD